MYIIYNTLHTYIYAYKTVPDVLFFSRLVISVVSPSLIFCFVKAVFICRLFLALYIKIF